MQLFTVEEESFPKPSPLGKPDQNRRRSFAEGIRVTSFSATTVDQSDRAVGSKLQALANSPT